MFVACPHCGFLVAAQSAGSQRCPRCGSAIDPKQARPLPPVASTAITPGNETLAETPDEPAGDAAVAGDPPPADPSAPPPPSTRRRRGTQAPSFVRRHAPAPARTGQRREWAAVVVLVLVLLLQMVLAQRDTLAADARWRPLVTGLCGVLRCDVPAWREPAAFTMLQRSVQPRPDTPGVLRVSASFRNDARWPQPWPTVLLTLSDMDGRQVGTRAFRPADYRSAGDAGDLAPGQSANIQLDVVEPARQVVAFSFDFR